MSSPRLLDIRQGVLGKNDRLAAGLRERFERAGVRAVNLLSSPGAGKTRLLEETLGLLGRRHRVAALVGDLATDNDARRLARSGAPVRQIETGDLCHLEADMVERHLAGWDLGLIDFLFVENVGNLVCPALFDLGESARVVLASVTEGADKPLKYPHMFRSADLVLLNKADLLPHVDFDTDAFGRAVQAVGAGAQVRSVTATRDAGIDGWVDWLNDALNGGTRSTTVLDTLDKSI